VGIVVDFSNILVVFVGGTEEKPEKHVMSTRFLVRIPTDTS
jgi:hypothetical protein